MTNDEIFNTVVAIIKPFAKNQEALARISRETRILDDLKVNSARLVDVVLDVESAFDIELADDEVDRVRTVGDAVRVVEDKRK